MPTNLESRLEVLDEFRNRAIGSTGSGGNRPPLTADVRRLLEIVVYDRHCKIAAGWPSAILPRQKSATGQCPISMSPAHTRHPGVYRNSVFDDRSGMLSGDRRV